MKGAAQMIKRKSSLPAGRVLRGYSTFEVKAVDEDARIIEGVATTPAPDRMQDVVEPLGAQFELPLPLIWMHQTSKPVGEVVFAKPTKNGIPFRAKIPKFDEPGTVKDRLDEAWHSLKLKLVRGVSIGFRSLEETYDKATGGFRFVRWEWLELSLVTIPANAEASISTIRSIYLKSLGAVAASGEAVTEPKHPGAAGAVNLNSLRKESKMKTIREQIAALEAKRAANTARMSEIMSKAAEEGRSTDAAEGEEYDTLSTEMKTIDADLKRLRDLEQLQVSQAAAPQGDSPEAASASRSGAVPIEVRQNLPKGTAFTRFAMALARAKGDSWKAIEIAKQWNSSTPEVVLALKEAVDPGTTTDAAWAKPLVQVESMASEFIELLRPATIIGRIPNFRRVPFNVKMPRQLTGSTSGWVGQAKPKPVSELSFDTVTLGFAKCAGIVVLSEELVRFSTPAAEAVVRQDMIDTISQFVDQQFIDPAVAIEANVSPASVTNSVVAIPSSGPSVAQVQADVHSVFQGLINSNLDIANAVWVMHPRTALSLSMLRTQQDIFAFPSITPQGGTFFGLPVVTSKNVPVGETSGDPTIIVLLSPNNIFMADDGGVMLDVSREASIQMDTAPTSGAQQLVSLWQNNLVGLRAERMINWLKRRAAAVQVINGVTY
jgi:HK97 family phage major capsid protein/HK97 family phage prohead protease